MFSNIATHWQSEGLIEKVHDAYHGWLSSTLHEIEDWDRLVSHIRDYGCIDLKKDTALASAFESHARGELGERSAYELDLDGMQSIAIDFGLEDLTSRITEAMKEGDFEPEDDSYERSRSSPSDDRGSDEYVAHLFGRLGE
ncbi:hypothetical protein SAM40697_3340 [Streptomyces ambofaciens]|uniref:CdiI immunity protein domain-containing protein n=1 Tax=Streptomyces ambofaciens TaxID=1889 RepID=A0ABM6B150_STRAM|nr:hypothetical protein SAM40697_3340 [Streptomyces ambofaciens]